MLRESRRGQNSETVVTASSKNAGSRSLSGSHLGLQVTPDESLRSNGDMDESSQPQTDDVVRIFDTTLRDGEHSPGLRSPRMRR